GMPWLGTFHSIGGRILRVHAELVQLKSNFTVLDVDDQIRLLKQLLQADNIRIFREQPDVLRQYQHRFKFILVDEYQDTNVAQYLWLRLLSQAPSSVI